MGVMMMIKMARKERKVGAIKYGSMQAWILLLATGISVSLCYGAGTLTPRDSPEQAIEIHAHHVDVVINNGFARTEVTQRFYNPNPVDLEGVYSFPIPPGASLAEMTIWAGEMELNGEVLAKDRADQIYQEEKSNGNDVGKAEKKGYQTFDFYVHPIPAMSETRMRFVYYQPLEIDTGVGRYIYPLESGGTDELAESFWTRNEEVKGDFSVNLTLKSAHPVVDVRVPGYENSATVSQVDSNTYTVKMAAFESALDRDFVFYYRLADNLPGRVEVIPYRNDASGSGTFMMIVTPGIDLAPLNNGADYIYVLDRSGSMNGGKIQTLAKGVEKAIAGMRPQDRFRIIAFNNSVHELTPDWVQATPENIERELQGVASLTACGGTNIHAGLEAAFSGLDNDRATSIVLVTDGVANQGVVDPKDFFKLVKNYDVRIFGFVMGNSANWPLMQIIGEATGGFTVGVSNDDDIVGQIMLAKSKICYQSLHDASIRIRGVKVHDTTDQVIGKVYRGQQLVLFGRYAGAGDAVVELNVRLSGEDKTYLTNFHFPEIDTDNPELERLWALNQIEQYKQQYSLGLLPAQELEDVERDMGVRYQLVTEETTMIVLNDEVFEQHGIERRNKIRIDAERAAQSRRIQNPVRNYTVDSSNPTFPSNAPRLGGGGALDPLAVTGIFAVLALAFRTGFKGRKK
jgi:Ca-activated chloride channel family protein